MHFSEDQLGTWNSWESNLDVPVVERWAYQCSMIRLKSNVTRMASDQSATLVKPPASDSRDSSSYNPGSCDEGVGTACWRTILRQRLQLSSSHSLSTSKRDALVGEMSGNTDRSTSLPLMVQGCFCWEYCKKRNTQAHGKRKASKQEWVRRKQ